MKNLLHLMSVTIALLMLGSTGYADTTFLGGDASDAGNWDNGLPSSVGNPGTIATNGTLPSTTVTNFYVTQNSGKIQNASYLGTGHSGGEWILNGGEYETRAMSISSSAAFIINGGTADLGNNARDVIVSGGASFTITGGTATLGRGLILDGGSFTMSGGALTVAGEFGCNNFNGGGPVYFNGGTVSLAKMEFGKNSLDFIFGGTNPGSLTADSFGGGRHSDANIDLNFLPGTQMSMSVTNETNWVNWAETLWSSNWMSYNGDTSSDLGLDWATVTSTGFGDGASFDFDGSTLSLSGGGPVSSFDITLDVTDSTLSFPTDSNSTYSVEFTTVLTNGFSEVTNFPGDGFTNTVPVDTSTTNGFYRVKESSSP